MSPRLQQFDVVMAATVEIWWRPYGFGRWHVMCRTLDIFPSYTAVMDDFGNLVKVPA